MAQRRSATALMKKRRKSRRPDQPTISLSESYGNEEDDGISRQLLSVGTSISPEQAVADTRAYLVMFAARLNQWAVETGVTWRCPQHKQPNPFCDCVVVTARFPFNTQIVQDLRREYHKWDVQNSPKATSRREEFRVWLASRRKEVMEYQERMVALHNEGWADLTAQEVKVAKFIPKGKGKAETKTKADTSLPLSEEKNGTYEFLVKMFSGAKGSTAAAAVTGLVAQSHGTLTDEQAGEKVEAFLTAAADPALTPEYRLLKRGDAENRQYKLEPVPKDVQQPSTGGKAGSKRKETSMAKKAAKVAKSNDNKSKKPGIIAYMLKILAAKARTREDVLAALEKEFPGRPVSGMRRTFQVMIAGSNPRQAQYGHKIKQTKKNGEVFFEVVLAK